VARGANENTVFSVSHPVKVQGQTLAAGRYGLHMIAGEKEWTIIFSKNSTSWGSFSYEPSEDALRVQTVPQAAPSVNGSAMSSSTGSRIARRSPSSGRAAVPFTIEVPDPVGLYVENLRNELRDRAGFTWQGWDAAANYLLQQNRDLGLALQWSENAVALPGVGQANFSTLSTKAQILDKLSRTDEAKAVMATALELPGLRRSRSTSTAGSCSRRERRPRQWRSSRRTRSASATRGPFTSGWRAATPRWATTKRRSSTHRRPCSGSRPVEQEQPGCRDREAEAGQGHERGLIAAGGACEEQ